MDFWSKLADKGMILGLSPMDGVTDAPFRYMIARHGVRKIQISNSNNQENKVGKTGDLGNLVGVDVMFTEFVSVDGLHFARGERRERMLKAFVKARDLGELERKPYEVAQVFGNKPELFSEAAVLIEQLGFDGVDINMGCPAKNVSENGCGAGLIRTPELAVEIVRAVKQATKLPVSVKTRIGVSDKSEMKEWISAIMEAEPACLSVHGRTLKQMYTGEADWEKIGEAAEIVHRKGGMILGNGDVKSVEIAWQMAHRYGVDGVLIGRAAQGNPAVFLQCAQSINDKSTQMIDNREMRINWMIEHARVYEQVYGKEWFVPMRKHLAWYAHGFPGAAELRGKLVRAESLRDVLEIMNNDKVDR